MRSFDSVSPKPLCRRGNVLVASAAFLVFVLVFAAFTIDVGSIAVAKCQLQNAVDAATLAGAMELESNADQATVATKVKDAVMEIAALNKVGNQPGLILDRDVDIELGRQDWNSATQSFVFNFNANATPYNIVRVTGRLTQINTANGTVDRRLPLFFAPVFGSDKTTMETGSVATYQPRELMMVLDYSASMNDDTELLNIPTLGATAITNGITQMWNDLGSPVYGSMPFTPAFLTVGGVSANGTTPHVDVTYRGTSAVVNSSLALSTVRLKFSNGNVQTFSGLSDLSGTFQGSGFFNSGKRITNVWVQSGTNADLSSEGWGEKFNFSDSNIVTHLGLGTYPYPSGSWLDFINYVNTSSYVNTAGFRYKYSTMCLINYWMEDHPQASQTPGLWVCSAQPITLLKNSCDTLVDYIDRVEADDKLGLVIYSHSNAAGAIKESGLTSDYASIKPLYRQRQAGHYTGGTNIYAGMKVAREELEAHSRPSAFRMMVLMTDGLPNQPANNPSGLVVNEAYLCKASKIRVMTVTVGVEADTALMQQVADITGGIHFNVPGGATYAEYEQALKDVFQKIASNRPLKLLPAP